MKRHLNRKKIDPKHADFWKKMLTQSFVVLLEREPGRVPGNYFHGHETSTTAALLAMHEGHGNTCILNKNEVTGKHIHLDRNCDIITAFYFPLIPGLRVARLIMSPPWTVAEWTPEGSEFRRPPLPLSAILDECRSLPTALTEIPWERILKGCRSRADYPVIHHDFGRTIEIDGEKYRRAVLVHPFIALVGLGYTSVGLDFEFADDTEQEFVFYQEKWFLGTKIRRHITQFSAEFAIDSDTLADWSDKGTTKGGFFKSDNVGLPEMSDLGRLLEAETDTRRQTYSPAHSACTKNCRYV